MKIQADVTGLVELLAKGSVSATELVDERIADILERDGALNAVVVHDFDRARDAAKAADVRLARGERAPMLGVPLTIKESFDIAGLPTSWGLSFFKDAVAKEDAVAVARLKAAGAIVVGKTNVSEGLNGWNATNPVYGRTEHPSVPGLTPGGSSSGAAAAIAAGLSPFDIGSDLGGSIRGPSHFCGIYGHDSSLALIPLRGHVLSGRKARLDLSSPGPMASSARDLRLGLSVMAGPDEIEAVGYQLALPAARHTKLSQYRVLVLDSHPLVPTDPEVRGAVQGLGEFLRGQGADVRDAAGIMPDVAEATRIFIGLTSSLLALGQTEEDRQAAFEALARLAKDDRSINALRLRATVASHAEWMDTNEARVKLRWMWREVFKTFDVVICPPASTPAISHEIAASPRLLVDGHEVDRGDLIGWAAMSKAAGLPATVIPFAHTQDGRPLGVQMVGPYLEDFTTIALAELISAARA